MISYPKGRQSSNEPYLSYKSDCSEGDIKTLNLSVRDQFNTKSDNAVNFYDVKSQKNLNYLLKGGYSCKFHEHKHYNAGKVNKNDAIQSTRLLSQLNFSQIGKGTHLYR